MHTKSIFRYVSNAFTHGLQVSHVRELWRCKSHLFHCEPITGGSFIQKVYPPS
ncbi:hypothetical protein ENROMM299B_17840 [Enterobacter roggenkampii]